MTMSIPCDCGAKATLREGRFGPYYACEKFCGLTVGADKGTLEPKGPLTDQPTRDARKRAHVVFDALWSPSGPCVSRSEAYRWMSGAMAKPSEVAHIGKFSKEECEKLIELCESDFETGRSRKLPRKETP